MITAESSITTIGGSMDERVFSLKGLSTDNKPEDTYMGYKIANGSTFFEMDTMKVVFFDAESGAWLES